MSIVNYYTNCLRIERTDGYVICLTELDKDLIISDSSIGLSGGDQTYLSAAGYTPTNMQQTSDNAVNNADVEGVLTSIGVKREDIIGGRYDFARLYIFIWDWKNNTFIKHLGTGHWGEVTIKDGSYVAEYRSLSQQLQQTIGRTFNPECDEQLGGTRCQIPLGLFPFSGSITAPSSKTEIVDSSLSKPDDYWNGSLLTWTFGDNNTVSSLVNDYILADKKLVLSTEMPNYIQKDDTYTISKNEITGNTVNESGSTIAFTDTSFAELDGYFANSQLVIDSGNNTSDIFTISSYISDIFTVAIEANDLFQLGDNFHINKDYNGTITSITDGTTPDPYIFSDSNQNTESDNFFNTLVLTFVTTANGNDGLTVTITDFVNATGTFTANNINLVGDIAIGDTYTITKVFNGSITSVDKKSQFKDSALTAANGYYIGMTVEFTNGLNNSETSIILNYSDINDIITLSTPVTNDIGLDNYKIDNIKTGSVTSGASKIFIEDSTIGATDYSGMYLEADSGLNEGDFRAIASSTTGSITLSTPFDNLMLNSDKYTIINMTGNTYMALGEVTNVTDNRTFTATLTEDGTYSDVEGISYFSYGKLLFKSGLNDEIHMEVKDFDDATNTFTLFLPMPFEIAIGDDFQVFAGCDKRLVTCKNKFSNHINFQGFPYIPGQDAITKFGGQ